MCKKKFEYNNSITKKEAELEDKKWHINGWKAS